MSVMMCCVVITTALIKCAHMRMVKQTGWTRPNDLILREPNCQPLASHYGQAVFLYPFRVYRQITDNLVFGGERKMNRLPVINMAATGQNIMRLRKQAGLTVGNLQQIFGFTTPQAIYKWQRGTALPTVDNLVILAAVFNTNINNILVIN